MLIVGIAVQISCIHYIQKTKVTKPSASFGTNKSIPDTNLDKIHENLPTKFKNKRNLGELRVWRELGELRDFWGLGVLGELGALGVLGIESFGRTESAGSFA
ncbi:MAG: hypothetical protein K2H17_04735, partial [Duncaniella sp.]|uniref:hypothetical protein n=1 Tax=Duncaniella sp. TaxID=2518496 RepID=UPI0023C10E39